MQPTATTKRRREGLERLGLLRQARRPGRLAVSLTAPEVLVAVLLVLAVVAVVQCELVGALVSGRWGRVEGVDGPTDALHALAGTLVVVGGLGVLAGLSLVRLRPGEPGAWRSLLVFGVCCLACVAAARALVALDATVAPRWRSLVYLTPLSAFAVFLTVLYGPRRALSASLLMALLVGLAVHASRRPTGRGGALPVAVVLLCGALVAVLGSVRIRRRVKLLAVGVLVGLTHVGILVGFELVAGRLQLHRAAPPEILWGLVNGLAVGVVMTLALPFIEVAFNVATDIRLLELADQEQPLLRSLVTRAPSTDHHSRRVALLADAAAESIGANPLVARVGAYYHDIGKMVKPRYFIENITGEESPHDRLRPTMSTLIITAHTKDGVELAQEARLPRAITDVVAQHHGDSVVEFFYNRYLEQAKDQDRHDHLDESFFRYPGPKPRSKEAAIVLLADSVEAAARTLAEPLPARIRALIRKITANKLRDGQLDDSGLTLRELHRVQDSFFRVLCAMHHARIEYPTAELDPLGRRR